MNTHCLICFTRFAPHSALYLQAAAVAENTYNILFLCGSNGARSIMAEALVTTMSRGRFHGYSAGCKPSVNVNPLTWENVAKTHYPIERLRSKSCEEFLLAGVPHIDFIIAMCDATARERCRFCSTQPVTAHWSFEDPETLEGCNEKKRVIFRKIFTEIVARMNSFVSLPDRLLEKHVNRAGVQKYEDV